MYDLNKQTFVMLTFSTVKEFHCKNVGNVTLQREAIVEVAAVKIKGGEIAGHYHTFVAIDGYDARNLEFEDNILAGYLNAEHLIGAPSFKEVVTKLHSYVRDSIFLVLSSSLSANNPFAVFIDSAKTLGYFFNSPTVQLGDILTARRLQSAVKESGVQFENLSVLKIAQMLVSEKESWADIFADYDIFFNPDSEEFYDKGRNDPLSWALAFSKLFIKLVEWGDETAIKPLDETLDGDIPF